MGSITSFPFLCLANAAMCRWALELSLHIPLRVRNQPLQRKTLIAPLLINGDDCTMKGNRANMRNLWTEITSFGGLTSSLGKTLFSLKHKPITVINSQTFDYVDGTWSVRKYVNLGILMSKPRSGCALSEAVRPYHVLGSMHRELKRACPESVWVEVSKRFIHYSKPILQKYPGIPWVAPEYLGGPGLIPEGEVSELDRSIMTLLIMNLNHEKKGIRKYPTVAEWKFDKLVKAKMTSNNFEKSNFREIREESGIIFDPLSTLFDDGLQYKQIEDEASKLYKYLVIENLFTKPKNEILKEKTKVNGKLKTSSTANAFDHILRKAYLHNERLYKAAQDQVKYGLMPTNFKVREWEELIYEKKESNFLVWGSLNSTQV